MAPPTASRSTASARSACWKASTTSASPCSTRPRSRHSRPNTVNALIGYSMETSDKPARQLYEDVKRNPTRKRFGFGRKPALINVDLQKAYTKVGEFITAYETNPKQLEYVNQLAAAFRAKNLPVVWTYVAYMESGEDCGVWGTRTNTPDSLQNIKVGSPRSEFDPRLKIDRVRDIVVNKRMASAFFETNIPSLMVWHGCDSVILTGG